ncbi:MAG: hypothetical protein HKM93_00010 [Desulfobacteraceae bacterium]|nr:hypothetical protein [Desulfobacteraceae bacterium]
MSIMFLIWGCGKTETPSDPRPAEQKSQALVPTVVETYPADGGTLWELDHPVYINFSAAVNSDDFSFSISPDPGQWNVSLQNEGKEAVLDHGVSFSPGAEYSVTVSLGKEKVKTGFKFSVFGPSSLQMIQVDQDEGKLDVDTAWLYRMQALFEPGKLPKAYQSKTPIKDGDAPIREFFRNRDRLSEQTLLKLRPYLVRPAHPDSIYYDDMTEPAEADNLTRFLPWPTMAHAEDTDDPRPVMPESVTCGSTDMLLFWAPKRYVSAAKAAAAKIDQYDIYNQFTKLMGREPLDDYDALFQNDGPNDQAKNGGDGRIDIYMIPSAQAAAGGYGGRCLSTAWRSGVGNTNRKSSAYILIDRNIKGDLLAATLAHELFHAFQCAFDALDDSWWEEATANWSEDYIKNSWNFEQDDIKHAFNRGKNRLKSLTLVNDNHEYGIYIYPYFLSKEYGDEVIADIWRACETKSSLDALDEAVPDGLDESLKRFAVPTLDYGKYQGEIRKSEETGMALYRHHKFKEIVLKKPGETISRMIKIEPLGVSYILVKNELKNPESTPMFRFNLQSFANHEDVTVQAVIDPKKDTRKEDWTGREERELCQNRGEDKFKEIAIIVNWNNRNPDTLSAAHKEPEKWSLNTELEIELEAEGCKEVTGTATVTAILKEETHTQWENTSPGGDKSITQTDLDSNGQATIRLAFIKKNTSYDKSSQTITQHYDITDSTVTSFTVNGRSYHYSYNYWKDRECGCAKKSTARPTLRNYELEDSGGMSITFDSETLKAKYVALPALAIYADYQEKSKVSYEGCCGSSGEENTMDIKRVPFVVGSVKAKDGEQLKRELKPETDQMQRIAKDSEKFAKELMDSMKDLANMDAEQTEEFYKNLDKKAEEFEKSHNIDQMVRNVEKKVIPEDLRVTSGDGEKTLGGGGRRVDQKKIENGTTSRAYELKWQISLKEKPSKND